MNVLPAFWKALPALLVLLAYSFIQHPFTHQLLTHATEGLPYYLGGALVFVSLTFNRSRLALTALNTCLAYAYIQNGLQSPLQERGTFLLYSGCVFIYAINLCLIALYRERGSLSVYGVLRLAFMFGSYLVFWWLFKSGRIGAVETRVLDALSGWLFTPLSHTQWLTLPDKLTDLLAGKPWITHFWGMTAVLSGLFLGMTALIKRTSIEYALLIAWLTGFLVFFDFAQNEISLLLFSTLTIALFIAFIQLSYDLAYVDTLTELPGRRALMEKLGTLGHRYAIAMLDVDHFKKFNDTWGHDVGDQVLKLVASQIRRTGGKARAFRYGGEEFTVVFPRKGVTEAMPYLEALRQAIADYPMVIRNRERTRSRTKGSKQRGTRENHKNAVHVTVSIGMAERTGEIRHPEDVIKKADEALYQAKAKGRNCVVPHATTSP